MMHSFSIHATMLTLNMNFQGVLAISLLTLLPVSTLGQSHTYIPFPDSNAIWVVKVLDEFGVSTGGYQYFIDGDTNHNGQLYNKIYQTGDSSLPNTQSGWFGLRNDTIARKIYMYDQGSHKEWLLYDFSLNEGDTIDKDFYGRYSDAIVVNIDTMLIDTNEHLIYYVDGGLMPYIEGIGSVAGLFEKPYFFEGGYELVCLMLGKNRTPYFTNLPNACKLYHYTGLEEPLVSQASIIVKPNPLEQGSVIELLSENDAIIHVSILNITGSLIYESNLPKENVFLIGDKILQKGMYYYNLLTTNGISHFGRIIK